jgi:hypothetical protein
MMRIFRRILDCKAIVRITLFALAFFPFFSASAQTDYSWWNKKHNWDGVTPWQQYLTSTPAYLGPNGLPVPETKTGLMPNRTSLEIAGEYHWGKGDKTRNLFASFFSPIGSDKAGLQVWMVPVEYYVTDTSTRDLRASREQDGKGYAVGDVYIGTYVQLVKDKPKLPDILLTINMKTASGGHFDAARFTDAPAYYFDMSFGKEYKLGEKIIRSVRPYAMGGFFCWQMNTEKHYQDDAPMYGAGVEVGVGLLKVDNSINGFWGYMDNGDRPLVYRAAIRSRALQNPVKYKLQFEKGLHDFPYTSLRAGIEIVPKKFKGTYIN